MNILKKYRCTVLFLLAFATTLQVGNTFILANVKATVDAIEPVVITECNHQKEPEQEEPEQEPVPIRINCRLDDETQQMILDKCEEYEIDFAFTMALIFKESSFRPEADSGSSVGLMQIHRINHGWLSEELGLTDFFDPEQNVTAGLYMLRNLFEKYDDPHLVLMAYNMGETGARKLWHQGIYTSSYSEGVMRTADEFQNEINERMGW